MEIFVIRTEAIAATVTAAGAELRSLTDASGAELLWQAGPAWPRHAPVLFPIVGRLAGDTLRHAGRAFRMTQHGFARDRAFTWAEREATRCRLVLTDDAATRAQYPFGFRLEIAYAVKGATLTVVFAVTNTGEAPLPASIGWHPAFAWPLRPGIAKTAHALTFEQPEPAPVRRVAGGLLRAAPEPSPVDGRTLALAETLFTDDALIFDQLASTGLRYAAEADETPTLAIGWHGLPQLGLWSKPGADFLCIEPWRGFASPEGFDGEFADKPGLMHIAPGHSETASVTVRVDAPIKG